MHPDPNQLPAIGLSDVLKLVLMLAVTFALVSWGGHVAVSALFGSVVIGLFAAQHFADTPGKEFLFLLIMPDVLFVLAMFVYLLPLFNGADVSDPGDVLGWLVPLFFMVLAGLGLALVPTTVALMTTIVLVALIYRLTGILLVRFDWTRERTDPNAKRVG